MTTRFRGRFGKQLACYLAVSLALIFIAYKAPLGSWEHPTRLGARMMVWAPVLMIGLASVLIHMIMRPVLVVDSVGARVERGLEPFAIRWDDVEGLSPFKSNRGVKTLGFKLDPSSVGANPKLRAQTGYDQILPNEWGVPLSEIEAAMREAIGEPNPDQPLSPAEQRAWLNTPQPSGPVFGHRARAF